MSGLAPWIARGAAMAIGVAIVIGVLAFAWAAGAVLVLMFIAVILGAALEPVVGWLRDKLPVARGAAVLLVYGAFLASVVALAFVISRSRSSGSATSWPRCPRSSRRPASGRNAAITGAVAGGDVSHQPRVTLPAGARCSRRRRSWPSASRSPPRSCRS